jgi:hypothetical protein
MGADHRQVQQLQAIALQRCREFEAVDLAQQLAEQLRVDDRRTALGDERGKTAVTSMPSNSDISLSGQ